MMKTKTQSKMKDRIWQGTDRIVNVVLEYAVPFDPHFTVDKALDDATPPFGTETAKVSAWVFVYGMTEKPQSLSPMNLHRVHDEEGDDNLNPDGVVFVSLYAQAYIRQLIVTRPE